MQEQCKLFDYLYRHPTSSQLCISFWKGQPFGPSWGILDKIETFGQIKNSLTTMKSILVRAKIVLTQSLGHFDRISSSQKTSPCFVNGIQSDMISLLFLDSCVGTIMEKEGIRLRSIFWFPIFDKFPENKMVSLSRQLILISLPKI